MSRIIFYTDDSKIVGFKNLDPMECSWTGFSKMIRDSEKEKIGSLRLAKYSGKSFRIAVEKNNLELRDTFQSTITVEFFREKGKGIIFKFGLYFEMSTTISDFKELFQFAVENANIFFKNFSLCAETTELIYPNVDNPLYIVKIYDVSIVDEIPNDGANQE
eukprot:NODE_1026_length_2550_cov_0.248062.p2 type:complete len:161 gc:universal NODE_1026_length_2550_cov_0.248062:229-711(+)